MVKYGSECFVETFLISLPVFSVNVLRCEIHSLLFGILTALPTGAASAIAVLGENSGPVVGVAISVSLLPPAVNAVSTGYKCAKFIKISQVLFSSSPSRICFIADTTRRRAFSGHWPFYTS